MTDENERCSFSRMFEKSMKLDWNVGRAERRVTQLAPPKPGAVIRADAGRAGHCGLHPSPGRRQPRRRRLEYDGRHPVAQTGDVQLPIANVDQTSGMGELAPFESGGDALVSGTKKQQEDDHHDHRQQQATRVTHRGSPFYSLLTSPYFSIREYSCARVSPSNFAARVLL